MPSLERFVAQHHRRFVRLAFVLTGSVADAEDLVADAYAGAWPRIAGGRVDDPVAYLRRCVVNGASKGPSPDNSGETSADLSECLALLPVEQRAVVALRYVEDLSEAETARVLGLPASPGLDRRILDRVWARRRRRRRLLMAPAVAATVAALVVGGGLLGRTVRPVHVTVGASSCGYATVAGYRADARLVFVATALAGPTARFEGQAVLLSPARMRVVRYLKGSGPRLVTVQTALTRNLLGYSADEDRITPSPGETWVIYSLSKEQPFGASICDGSHPIGGKQ